jgi:2-methylcitrate dehydratase PrpD
VATNLSEGLAGFIVDLDYSNLGPEAIEKAKKVVADTVAVILSGAGSEVAPPMLDFLRRMAPGPVPIPGTRITASSPGTALAGGTFGAALDFDDVLSMMPGHPAAVIVPALMAQLQSNTVDGQTFIDTYLVGLEVGSKLSQGVGLKHYFKGFHVTGTIAVFCGVGALSRCFGLEPREIRMALSLAASTASGLHANFGTMAKPFHSGWAAQSSVITVDLVRSGMTASLSALEDSGDFFSAYGTEESNPDKVLPLLGNPWTILDPGIALKKFPTCYATHRAIDGIHQIETRVGRLKDQLAHLVCKVAPGALLPLRFPVPKTGLEGKFSMPFGLAAALHFSDLKIASFSDAAVTNPDITALYDKITVSEDIACTEGDPDYEQKSSGTRGIVIVEATLADGRVETCHVKVPPGHPQRELTWDELRTKFLDCAESCGVALPTAEGVFASLKDLEKIRDVGALLSQLSLVEPRGQVVS